MPIRKKGPGMGLDYEGILNSWLNPDIYYDPSLTDPAVVTADLPAKFNGSQEAARRYAEGYRWGQQNVVVPRERVAPYVGAGLAATMAAPWLIDVAATGALNGVGKLGNYFANNPVGRLWAKMLPRAGADLAGFEAVNRLPNAWGDKTMLEQAGDIGRWAAANAYRLNGPAVNSQTGMPYANGWYTPEGEEIAGNVGNAVGQFVGMIPTGMAGSMLVNGAEFGSNAITRSAANRMARRADYMRPISDMMQERGIESTNLSGSGRRDIQTLIESGEMNPMDLDVSPNSVGHAPINLVRDSNGRVMRTPDGYVIRRGRDLTQIPDNGWTQEAIDNAPEFFYDNAGRRYDSIAEATGEISSRLTPEQNRALREQIQRQVNETLDRINEVRTQRLQRGEFDWDAFERNETSDRILANNNTGQIVSINPETGELLRALDMESTDWLMPQEEAVAADGAARLFNPSRLSTDEIVIPEATPEEMETLRENTRNLISRFVRQDMSRITNTRSLADLDAIDRDLRLGRIADQNTSSYLGDINRGLSAGDEDWYSLQEDYDILRDAVSRQRASLNEDARIVARRRLDSSLQSVQNMYEDELNQLSALDRNELLESLGLRAEDLNAGLTVGDSDYMDLDAEYQQFLRRLSERRRQLSQSVAQAAQPSGPREAVAASGASNAARERYYNALVDNDARAVREAYADMNHVSLERADREILRNASDELKEAYVRMYEEEALSSPDALSEYLDNMDNVYHTDVIDIHGDPKLGEESFFSKLHGAFPDDASRDLAAAKLRSILEPMSLSDRARFRLSRDQFNDIYSGIKPIRFTRFDNLQEFLRAKGFARRLNEIYKDSGIDFTKIDTPEEFANIVQQGLRRGKLVDSGKELPLDISHMSYRSSGDPRGSWLAEKFYNEFGNVNNPYAGISMDGYMSTSADSKQMQYIFSGKNYGDHPGGVTWQLAPGGSQTNMLERNSVYIDASGKPVFVDERTARKAARAGLDAPFSSDELDYLNKIIRHEINSYEENPVYLRAKKMAELVASETGSRLNSPLEYIAAQDPVLNRSLLKAAPLNYLGDRDWLRMMLNPRYETYVGGDVGFTPVFSTPAPLITRHKYGGLLDRLNSHYGDKAKVLGAVQKARENQFAKGGYKKGAKAASGDKYYDIVRQRRNSAFNALLRSGMTTADAKRLAPMIVAQQVLEGGWVLNRKDNNFGGMRASGKTLAYDSEDAFQDAYIKMLDSKWHTGRPTEYSWRSAQDMDDWARILNREDLNLTTKDAWEKYNKDRQGNDFVYLYAPQWENGTKSYRDKLRGVENWTNAYLDMVGMDEPYENLVLQMDLRQRYLNNQPEFVQQMAPEKKVSPPLFNALIPTSVKKLMNNREDGGLLLKDYRSGGKIHIKPENRGKFTALKKRTGHSASWFKAHGTPAQKKMAVFALNAKKWKHGDGGIIERYGADRVRQALTKMKG